MLRTGDEDAGGGYRVLLAWYQGLHSGQNSGRTARTVSLASGP